VGIHKAEGKYRGERFAQGRAGLHHVCLRARERADVDAVYQFLLSIGATIIRAPEGGAWAAGYYSVLFEDPDGIRLEINHIPGKGLLSNPPR
jgi:catechol 2,3-dioxygenase-like lactoylglutathione lyase family enzyme